MADQRENLTISVSAKPGPGGLGVFSDLEKTLDRVKEKLGPRSFGKDLAEIAVGGGAVAGISFIGNTFAAFGERVAKVSDELRLGKKSFGEFAAEGARSIPVLGGFIKGFDALQDAVSGARAELEKIAEAEKNAMGGRAAFAQRRQSILGLGEGIAQINAGTTAANLRTSPEMVRSIAATVNSAFAEIARGVQGFGSQRALVGMGGNQPGLFEQLQQAQQSLAAINAAGAPAIPARRVITSNTPQGNIYNDGEIRLAAKAREDYLARQKELTDNVNRLSQEYKLLREAHAKAGGAVVSRLSALANELGTQLGVRNLLTSLPGGSVFGFSPGGPAQLPLSPFTDQAPYQGEGTDPLLGNIIGSGQARAGARSSAMAMIEQELARRRSDRSGPIVASGITSRGDTGVIRPTVTPADEAENRLVRKLEELRKQQDETGRETRELARDLLGEVRALVREVKG